MLASQLVTPVCTATEFLDVANNVCKAKATQSITGLTLPALSVGNKATLAASTNSGLAVSYASQTTAVCTVNVKEVTAIAAGTCTIAANQTGDATHLAAAQVLASQLVTPVCNAPQHLDTPTNSCVNPPAMSINAPTTTTVGETILLALQNAWSNVVKVVWSFGQGIADVVAAVTDSISQTFSQVGDYIATATMYDANNAEVGTKATTTITVTPSVLPVASLAGSPSTATVGQPVSFVLSASQAVLGQLCKYTLDTGAGQGISSLGCGFGGSPVNVTLPVSVSYATAGNYTATLTVTDSQGKTATATWAITVNDALANNTGTGLLNDTGITQCANDTTIFADCSAANLGGWFGLNQDGQTGRDVLAATGQLTKVGAGDAGFDFTKISATGQKLPANALTWSCVLDNQTGLMWEVKTNDGGLHDTTKTYTWYNTDATTNGGFEGYENSGNNTQAFTQAVNAQGLCGYNDWYVPDHDELKSLVNYGKFSPSIDTNYFPNTQSSWYWSSSPLKREPN